MRRIVIVVAVFVFAPAIAAAQTQPTPEPTDPATGQPEPDPNDPSQPEPPPDPTPPEPPLPEPEPPPPQPEPQPQPPVEPPGQGADTGVNAPIYSELPALTHPTVTPDTLAFGSALDMVAASAELTSTGQADNGVDDELTLYSASIATRYFRSLEKTGFGYSVEINASDSLSRVPALGGSQITNVAAVDVDPDVRVYPAAGSEFFLHITVDANVTLASVFFTESPSPDADSIAPGQIGAIVGPGFGRVLSIDPVVRLRRLEMALQSERILGSPVTSEVGSQIILDWYALRNDIGNYRQLAYAMKHMTEAGNLTSQPNLRGTFKALQVLDDPFIFDRRKGWDVRGGFGVAQPFIGYDDADEPDAVFVIAASAQYEKPISTTQQLSLIGKASFDPGDVEDAARPWNVRGFLTFTNVFYTERFVPTGSLTLSAESGISGLRIDDMGGLISGPDTGLDVVGSVAYSRLLNRGSLATVASTLTARNDGIYSFVLSLGVTWGIESGFYTPYVGGAQLN